MRPIPAAVLACALAAVASSAQEAPLAARATASPEAAIGSLAPIRVEIPAGGSKATAPATVGPHRDATFLFAAPARVALTIGVASQSGEARLTIYEPGSSRPAAGTEREAGCIRWIGQSQGDGDLRIEVHTAGSETPARLEVSIDRQLDFNDDSR